MHRSVSNKWFSTVPASFDMAARELTRQAALQAGFPSDFILLEDLKLQSITGFMRPVMGGESKCGLAIRCWYAMWVAVLPT